MLGTHVPKLFDSLTFKNSGKKNQYQSQSALLKHIVNKIFALPEYSAASEKAKITLSDAIQSTIIVTSPGDMFLLAKILCGRRISLASNEDKLQVPSDDTTKFLDECFLKCPDKNEIASVLAFNEIVNLIQNPLNFKGEAGQINRFPPSHQTADQETATDADIAEENAATAKVYEEAKKIAVIAERNAAIAKDAQAEEDAAMQTQLEAGKAEANGVAEENGGNDNEDGNGGSDNENMEAGMYFLAWIFYINIWQYPRFIFVSHINWALLYSLLLLLYRWW